MPHITLPQHLPGITGLLEYRLDTALPIRELTQILLRGDSTLTQAERELIATVVSYGNECTFCMSAHTAAADLLLGEATTAQQVKTNPQQAPVSEKMKALLEIARMVQKSGRNVTPQHIEHAKSVGATDREIHDTVLIAALFCLYNKYVDGLASVTPSDPGYYATLADRIVNQGYLRPQKGFDHLKKQ
jgi:uncharacterized peroxidase-related enzyme